MKVGILYICTGRYHIFWDSFYKSCERYFLPGCERKYIVFTDNNRITTVDNIVVFNEEPKGFPLDSLLRFDMFLKAKDEFADCDYLFFFNSNIEFKKPVLSEEILPNDSENGLVGVLHLGYYKKPCKIVPYEKRRKSTAYIPYKMGEEKLYFMGGLNGGTREAYLKLVEECYKAIHIDMDNGIMALYHDESHINRYLHGKRIKVLSPKYGTPEGWTEYKDPSIVILNKVKHGGEYFDKLPSDSYMLRIKLLIKRICRDIIWKLL